LKRKVPSKFLQYNCQDWASDVRGEYIFLENSYFIDRSSFGLDSSSEGFDFGLNMNFGQSFTVSEME
jgi:phage anti-repressor protein